MAAGQQEGKQHETVHAPRVWPLLALSHEMHSLQEKIHLRFSPKHVTGYEYKDVNMT